MWSRLPACRGQTPSWLPACRGQNTQLAALDRDVKQLQKQQPKLPKQTVAETPTATPGQQARRGSSGVAEDAHGSIVPERAHNFLLHRFLEGAEKEQSSMQLVEGVVHGDLGVKRVEILSANRVNGNNPASPVLVQVGDAAQCIKVLRAASQLQYSTRYKGVGLTPDLTKQQREHKQKQWGNYLSFKRQGYTVCFHGGHPGDVEQQAMDAYPALRRPAATAGGATAAAFNPDIACATSTTAWATL